jgi:hypothetical protein
MERPDWGRWIPRFITKLFVKKTSIVTPLIPKGEHTLIDNIKILLSVPEPGSKMQPK